MKKKKILLTSLSLFLVIQVFQTDKSTFDIKEEDKFATIEQPPLAIEKQIKEACYDCHSYETTYPWWTYVAPVSWWTGGHVKKARKAINFSTWGQMAIEDQKHTMQECAKKIEKGHMPPKGYVRMHASAYFEGAEKQAIIDWFKKENH